MKPCYLKLRYDTAPVYCTVYTIREDEVRYMFHVELNGQRYYTQEYRNLYDTLPGIPGVPTVPPTQLQHRDLPTTHYTVVVVSHLGAHIYFHDHDTDAVLGRALLLPPDSPPFLENDLRSYLLSYYRPYFTRNAIAELQYAPFVSTSYPMQKKGPTT